MLQNKIGACRALLSEVVQNQKMEHKNADIANQNSVFFDVFMQEVIPMMVSLIEIKGDKEFSFSEEAREGIKKCIADTKETFNTKTVIRPNVYKKNVAELSNQLKQEWENQAEALVDDTIGNLEILKLVYPDKAKVNSIIADLNEFTEWPVHKEGYKNYTKALETAQELLQTMHFDTEIEEFLYKVKDKTATLQDLSDAVLQWLRDSQLMGKISLGIK